MKVGSFQARWLERQLDKAHRGKVGLLSRVMQELIPFNRPHRIRIESLDPNECAVALPWRKRNLNHLGTMHACALATAAEYSSGLCLLGVFGMRNTRLIMSKLEMTYLRRAESACSAKAQLSEDDLKDVRGHMDQSGRATLVLSSTVTDEAGEVVAEAKIVWHLKRLSS